MPPATTPAAAPARTPPAASPAGRLLIRSVPAGADVAIDGERRGVTPLTLREVTLGTRRVTVSRDGYAPVEQRVALTAARPSRTVDVTLRAARPAAASPAAAAPAAAAAREGSLNVESRPAGARVIFDGRPVGVTPLVLPGLAPGTYTVRVELDGYQPVTASARIVAGERARVAVTLVTGRF